MQDSKGGHIGSGATVDYIHGKTLQDPSRLAGSKSIYEDLGWDEDVDDLV